ncbi:MAG: DNA-directed DNA polymerase [Candidatus Micrarchaeota archaeon]|nr:DNA-directed DNA polymerase [Candidatus Micrarchaeota archaeon]
MHKAFLLDVDIAEGPPTEEGIRPAAIQLVLRSGGQVLFRKVRFSPYFYFVGKVPKELVSVPQVASIEEKTMLLGREQVKAHKVVCHSPADIPKLRELFKRFGTCYEADIPYVRRYMIDSGVRVFSEIAYEEEKDDYITVKSCVEAHGHLNALSFDIETYNPHGTPSPREDPAIVISYATGPRSAYAITYGDVKDRRVEKVRSEGEMIAKFCEVVRANNVDILYGYNSSDFDLPYLRERAQATRTRLELGRDNSAFTLRSRGMFSTASINGRIHADVFHMVRFLAGIGALKTNTYTLGEVYREMLGGEKASVPKLDIWKMWNDAAMREQLVDYAIDDARATYLLGERMFPIFVEIARVAGITLDDAVSSTTGQLVEHVLLGEAHKRGVLAPNKPKESEVAARDDEPIEGAYVKLPEPGIYDRIMVFDFRSLYPSIIVSHNISPETMGCDCCKGKDAHVSPDGTRFCSKRKGIIPEVLASLLQHRATLKRQMKGLDKDSPEYVYANARQYAFKIIANSFYGMLRYVRARWYCRECASATTAWERHYIQDVIARAEAEGFKVLYSDTDSIFLLLGNKDEKDALAFMDKVNKSLPKDMELELEDYYTRGIFVSKKSAGGAGAKKKYALLSRDGGIKIRGFELVRRDWSGVAKDTQRRVLETVLRDGSIDKALKIVNETVELLRSGKAPLRDLVMYSALRKEVGDYKATGPEVSAAIKAKRHGIDVREGQLIGYVITSKGKSISEKAQLAELVEEGDYDADYYISKQVLPAVEKILGELGYSGDLLRQGKKQHGISDWL